MTSASQMSVASELTSSSTTDLTMSVGSVQGRIKVYVRPRAFDDVTFASRGGLAVKVGGHENDEISVMDDKGRESSFGFDHVFATTTHNNAVFDAVGRPIVNSVLCGYNGTLMAYGQTGTGKTHTLGSPSDGMMAQMFSYLFTSITAEATANPARPAAFRVTMSYVQVYKEKVFDLLHPVEADRPLTIRERPAPQQNNEPCVYIDNVTEHAVGSAAEALSLIECGRKRLVFAETKMNRHSSRSHAACLVGVERIVKRGGGQRVGGLSASLLPSLAEEADDSACGGGGDQALGVISMGEIVAEEAVAQEAASQLELERAIAQEHGEVSIKGRLTIVDLAGSERIKRTGAEGGTLAEVEIPPIPSLPVPPLTRQPSFAPLHTISTRLSHTLLSLNPWLPPLTLPSPRLRRSTCPYLSSAIPSKLSRPREEATPPAATCHSVTRHSPGCCRSRWAATARRRYFCVSPPRRLTRQRLRARCSLVRAPCKSRPPQSSTVSATTRRSPSLSPASLRIRRRRSSGSSASSKQS